MGNGMKNSVQLVLNLLLGLNQYRVLTKQAMRAFLTIVAVIAMFVGCARKQTSPPAESAEGNGMLPLLKGTQPQIEAALKRIQADYDAALADSTNSIRYAAEFAKLFPGAVASFSYYTGEVADPNLNMEIYLHARYEFIMQIPVTFDASRRKVKTFGKPDFVLTEFSKIEKIHDQLSMEYAENGERRFGASEWKKLVAARGDFSAIGYTIVTNSPVPGFDELQRRTR